MDSNRASITALITAYRRAYHATYDSPKIFDDFLADSLFTADEHAFFNQNLAGLLKIINPDRAAANPDQSPVIQSFDRLLNCAFHGYNSAHAGQLRGRYFIMEVRS